MDKIALIKQPAGLGDILFTSKIRVKLSMDGYKVIHPVVSEYKWLSDYIEGNFPTIENFEYADILKNNNLNPSKFTIGDKELYLLPLQTADRVYDGSVMDAKYKLMGIDNKDWLDYFSYKRNYKKEKELYDLLGLVDNDDYIVVNNKFGSPPNYKIKEIKIENKCKIINIDFYEGYTLFDWLGVLENAKEIHVVESSINFLLEKENIDANKVFIYSKHTPSSFFHVKHLFSKNWNYIY